VPLNILHELLIIFLWYVQTLVEEFETQESTLKEMKEQVKTYSSAGKYEAAARLQEQMLLLQVSHIYRNIKYLRSYLCESVH
jgi:hypothetical protein